MSAVPLLSYIVLSYNYERYIGKTIRSILDQTVQDFEIVVVDDVSQDGSLEVIRGFKDPRIRLLVNESNRGGAGSYNRAIEAARGEWLVNLDADDWIAPQKSEIQLKVATADPLLDIIGTYVNLVDETGAPARQREQIECLTNQPHDLNLVDSWIGRNSLCRSSTMVRRSAHQRIGLDDPAMVRAPDYELWTRALRMGSRFAVVPERLTYSRLQSQGVTKGDPLGTLLEIAYAMLRNLVPLAEARALNPSLGRIVTWVARHEQISSLRPVEAYRLLGMLMTSPTVSDFPAFRNMLSTDHGDAMLTRIGRRVFVVLEGSDREMLIAKLTQDIEAYVEARDYWHRQSDAWEAQCLALHGKATEEPPRLKK